MPRLILAWQIQGGRTLTRAVDGGHRLDWVRLTGTANDGSGVSVGQYYVPQPVGFFIYYNDIKVFDPKLPPGSLLKRMFRLESSPSLSLGLSGGTALSSSGNATRRPVPSYFLREYLNDGSGGGGTHKSYGLTRPGVRTLLDDVLSVVNRSTGPTVAFIPGRPGRANTCSNLPQVMEQLNGYISRIQLAPNRDGARSSLQILKRYVEHLVAHPENPKYKNINTNNAAFQSRVKPFDGAEDVLRLVGFTESSEDASFLTLSPEKYNAVMLRQTLQKLEQALATF